MADAPAAEARAYLFHQVTKVEQIMAGKIWEALSNELAETAVEAGKSVVTVQGRRHPCSGVAWTSDSVVTVDHALKRDEEIGVVLAPGQRVSARVAGRDPSTDLAVLRLDQPAKLPLPRWSKPATCSRPKGATPKPSPSGRIWIGTRAP